MRIAKLLPVGLAAGLALALAAAPAAAQETGSVKGTFVLEGDIPVLDPRVEAGENVRDGAVCAANPIPNQSIVVDPETKGLANVFIWIQRVNERDIPEEFKTPKEPNVVIDQKGCVFIPHAFVARTGQTLVMLNGDSVAHNVHVSAIRGDSINDLVAPNDREGVKRKLTKTDILPMPIVCDIHPFMKARILIVDHPYAAVSGAQGQFEIVGLPPGKYDFKVYHEAGAYIKGIDAVENVEVKAGQATDLGALKVDVKDLEDRS